MSETTSKEPIVFSQTKSTTPQSDLNVIVRAVLVVALAITLVGAMRWAVSITNANARQVSTNLTSIQKQFDEDAISEAKALTKEQSDNNDEKASETSEASDKTEFPGPSVEPVERATVRK